MTFFVDLLVIVLIQSLISAISSVISLCHHATPVAYL